MKHAVLFATLLILFSTACKTPFQKAQKKTIRRTSVVPKELRKEFPKEALGLVNGLTWIPGGTFTMGSADLYHAGEKDSTLLPSGPERRVTVPGFYMSNHEVTNAEYKEFVYWVRDSMGLSLLAKYDTAYYLPGTRLLNWSKRGEIWTGDSLMLARLAPMIKMGYYKKQGVNYTALIYTYTADGTPSAVAVYPDTLCFYRDFTYSFNEPMTQMYFWHPKYQHYPVIGITWQQANAYCHWLTGRYRQELIAAGKGSPGLEFRLPTEAEWEYAAVAIADYTLFENIHTKNIFPWPGHDLRDKEGNYLANFGPVEDRYGFMVKYYTDDGSMYPDLGAKYPANGMGLYDMAGNVAEWTLDGPPAVDTQFLEQELVPLFYRLVPEYEKEMMAIWQKTKVQGNDTRDSAKQRIVQRYWMYAKLEKWDTSTSRQDTVESLIINDDFIYRKVPVKQRSSDSAFINELAERRVDGELQFARALYRNPSGRILKGGSWADGPVYLQCGAREVYPENRSNSRTGFRVVLAVVVVHTGE